MTQFQSLLCILRRELTVRFLERLLGRLVLSLCHALHAFLLEFRRLRLHLELLVRQPEFHERNIPVAAQTRSARLLKFLERMHLQRVATKFLNGLNVA